MIAYEAPGLLQFEDAAVTISWLFLSWIQFILDCFKARWRSQWTCPSGFTEGFFGVSSGAFGVKPLALAQDGAKLLMNMMVTIKKTNSLK